MDFFFLFSVLITLAAIISYINVRLFKLPAGIMLMLMGTLIAVILIIAGNISDAFTETIKQSLSMLNFSEFLLGILLSFLLFAGSLHINYKALKYYGKIIFTFATMGTLLSTFLMGTAVYYLLQLFQIHVSFIWCLLFGALISPTDPVAVLSIIRKTNIPKSVEIKITGESLFNDGIGVVIFATILEASSKGIDNLHLSSVLNLFLREAVGGVIAGLLIGYTGYKMMKSINHFQTEILITLAMVMGGYSLCHYLHVSGPLAMVVAGIFTGNKAKKEAMSDTTRDYIEKFWEVTDEVLNAVLFILIGLQLVVVRFSLTAFILGIISALLLVIVRFISLWLPSKLFRFKNKMENKTIEIMTWGGLRGGISIALALSLPNDDYKNIFVGITFTVVLFSILVQGFTIERFIKFVRK
ncbi:MAG: sodium:proton antiporter [Parafilimonas sp.]